MEDKNENKEEINSQELQKQKLQSQLKCPFCYEDIQQAKENDILKP